jgi:nicotinate-nucleotide--dimethylbenzimidazole phosphoribosyltransferase
MGTSGDKHRIQDLITNITPLDSVAMEQARARQQVLTKPAGSLGRLEELAVQIAGITGQAVPTLERKAVIVMVGDHGVTAEGVSAFPSEVTVQMVSNFLRGGAAINVLARHAGAQVLIVDVGVACEIDEPGLISRKVAPGTANMFKGPAMTEAQMFAAIQVGIDVLDAQADQGIALVATGEMGIGNTTASSAITAALLGLEVARVTGRGTGIDDRQLAHKIHVIERALATNTPDSGDPFDVLMKVGGLEIAGMVGVILGAAAHYLPVVIAAELCPLVCPYLIAGHVSVEPGHQLICLKLGLTPLLNLKMRLGEGTGAVLAMNIIEAALCTHREMATFAEAGVSTREEHE